MRRVLLFATLLVAPMISSSAIPGVNTTRLGGRAKRSAWVSSSAWN